MDKFIKLSSEQMEARLTENSIVNALWSKGIITLDEKQSIGDLKMMANRQKLIEILLAVDDSWVDTFIDIVEDKSSGRERFIKHLRDNRVAVFGEPTPPSNTDSSLLGNAVLPGKWRTPVAKSPRTPTTPNPPQPQQQQHQPMQGQGGPGSESGSGSLLKMYTPEIESKVTADALPFSMIYEPKHPTKGHVLVINNISFEDDVDGTMERHGAAVDTDRLTQLFYEFQMKVYPTRDVTMRKFQVLLHEFKQVFKSDPADACIVVIMSHGDHRDRVLTSDHKPLQIHGDILQQFNNENFEEMIGRPKIFFFQSCRGEWKDRGTTQPDSGPFSPTLRIPTWTDMLVCYSTLEGHYAYRDTVKGSWFMEIACDVFKTYAQKKVDICRMLNIVAEKMKAKETEEGAKQICPWTNIGFTKEFYFEPKQQ